jgi:hypothetical protein
MNTRKAFLDKKKRALTGFLATIFLIVLLIIIVTSGDGSDDSEVRSNNTSAILNCIKYAEKSLPSTSSAEYQSPPGVVVSRIDNRFVVLASVDLKDELGARVRLDITCTIEYMGQDQWELLDLQFSGR